MRFGVEQGMKARSALGSDNAGVDKEGDELIPGEVVSRRRGIGEIEGKASGDEVGTAIGE